MLANLVPPIRGRQKIEVVRVLFGDRLRMLQHLARAAGPVGSIRFGRRIIVLVNEPSLVHEVLVTQASAFHKGPALSICLLYTSPSPRDS